MLFTSLLLEVAGLVGPESLVHAAVALRRFLMTDIRATPVPFLA
jgi:hypothetical protein